MPSVAFTLLLGMVPAPPELVDAVREIQVETSTEEASMLRLRFAISRTAIGDWSILDTDPFRPLLPVGLRIQAGVAPPEAVINGYVNGHQVTYSEEGGKSQLEVTAMDATLLMNLVEKVMAWPNLPDSAIAAAIFGQYALVPQIQPTSPSLTEPEGTTTQRGTDVRFLKRLAERNGFECYIQPEPLSGVDFGYFRPPQISPVPQAVLNVNMGDQTNVLQFHAGYDMVRPTSVIAAGLDVSNKSIQPALAPVSAQLPLGLEPALLRVMPPPVVRPTGTGLARSADLQGLAQSIADRSSFAVTAEGEVGPDVGILKPGGIVNIRGAGRQYSGSYYLTRVSHTITPTSYTQRFHARRNAVGMTGGELFVQI